jgi:hypothetical protein
MNASMLSYLLSAFVAANHPSVGYAFINFTDVSTLQPLFNEMTYFCSRWTSFQYVSHECISLLR